MLTPIKKPVLSAILLSFPGLKSRLSCGHTETQLVAGICPARAAFKMNGVEISSYPTCVASVTNTGLQSRI